MPKYYYDLHIHSTLSPCGDASMTPNNIVNMASIKQLDIIAVTDHNCAKHVHVISKLAQEQGILLIPGIEVESSEEVHLLCLFANLEQLNRFSHTMYEGLPNMDNDETFFGSQTIFNELDEKIGSEQKLLCTSTSFTILEIIDLVHSEQGIVFAAHIDKRANSILSNLGFIPTDLKLDGIELSHRTNPRSFLESHPQYRHYNCIQNSDAHYLKDISERLHSIELPCNTTEAFIDYFRS
ncbi:PHP domain-containing protein [Haloplasma contractile]|uniref:PHP domain protein n=1 Tax=Haloplasma contractile SSD-17B TaxID=1033810 RepID=U2E882_9MOLU|nr:PHP domain-containing protein [Haloplasma contractile]ERJ11096.1 PHP domain protein [Haloplasma contractile SSD-17B]